MRVPREISEHWRVDERIANKYVFAIAHALDISEHQALCHTSLLVYWFLANQIDDDVRYHTEYRLAQAAMWQGDRIKFVDALKRTGWIDQNLMCDRARILPVYATGRPIGEYWARIRRNVIIRDEGQCRICGVFSTEIKMEVDHIIPVCEYGTSDYDNLRLLCKPCNRSKGREEGRRAIARKADAADKQKRKIIIVSPNLVTKEK